MGREVIRVPAWESHPGHTCGSMNDSWFCHHTSNFLNGKGLDSLIFKSAEKETAPTACRHRLLPMCMYIHTCVGIFFHTHTLSHTHTVTHTHTPWHTHTHTPYTHRQQSRGETHHKHTDDRLSRGGEEGCQVKGEHDTVWRRYVWRIRAHWQARGDIGVGGTSREVLNIEHEMLSECCHLFPVIHIHKEVWWEGTRGMQGARARARELCFLLCISVDVSLSISCITDALCLSKSLTLSLAWLSLSRSLSLSASLCYRISCTVYVTLTPHRYIRAKGSWWMMARNKWRVRWVVHHLLPTLYTHSRSHG